MISRKGRFELADNGTLFLDEIGELPLSLQAKLLRVLQEKEYYPLGSEQAKYSNARIIAATNRNLKHQVESGKFRSDLFYRLHVFPLHIPPLRDREGDITLLARHFLKKYSQREKKQIYRMQRLGIKKMNK